MHYMAIRPNVYDSEIREKAVAIVQRLRDATDAWKEESVHGFSLCFK